MPKIPGHVPTYGNTEILTMDYCPICKRVTVRIVFPGNRQLCLGHSRKAMTKDQIRRAEERARMAPQFRLF